MKDLNKPPYLSEFILKSTLGVALITILLVSTFSIINFVSGRYIIAFITFTIVVFSSITAYFCYKGKYSRIINLYVLVPCIILANVFAMRQLGVTGSYWAFIGMFTFHFILPEKNAWIVNVIFLVIIIPVAWNILNPSTAFRFSAVLFGSSGFAYISMNEIFKQHKLLENYAVTDALTRLYNRSLLQSSIERAIHQAHRTNTAITLLMLDLDHFKIINDKYGHNTGDLVLKSVADILKNNFRASDMVFRIGGEEFLILMHNTDKKNSLIIAEKLRKEIEQLSIIPDQKITTSIGVSEFQSGKNWEDWMKQCDKNLYLAKSKGRNLVFG